MLPARIRIVRSADQDRETANIELAQSVDRASNLSFIKPALWKSLRSNKIGCTTYADVGSILASKIQRVNEDADEYLFMFHDSQWIS
jgi:hypothetical protein